MEKRTVSILDRADNVIDTGCKLVLYLTCTAIFLILLANVVLRYFFDSSLEWASEVPELLFPWFVMAGIVLATAHNAHINIEFLVARVGPTVSALLATLRAALILGCYGVLSWAALELLPIVADERSPVLGVPNSVTYFCLLLGFALIGFREMTIFVRNLRGVRTTHELVPYQ